MQVSGIHGFGSVETCKIGRNGTRVIPAKLRRRGALKYSARRKAEFLLNNAVDAADYRRAVRAVRKLGLDPEEIPHRRP